MVYSFALESRGQVLMGFLRWVDTPSVHPSPSCERSAALMSCAEVWVSLPIKLKLLSGGGHASAGVTEDARMASRRSTSIVNGNLLLSFELT